MTDESSDEGGGEDSESERPSLEGQPIMNSGDPDENSRELNSDKGDE